MPVVYHLEAQQLFTQWPDVVCTADDAYNADVQLSTTFHEAETRKAFLALSAHLKSMEVAASANHEHLLTISQCTEQFSPSKPQDKVKHFLVTASVPHCYIKVGMFT